MRLTKLNQRSLTDMDINMRNGDSIFATCHPHSPITPVKDANMKTQKMVFSFRVVFVSVLIQIIMKGEPMSVLIKDMEMPETCEDCPFHIYHSHYEYVCVATPLFYPWNLANSKGIRKDWCPLVEAERQEE